MSSQKKRKTVSEPDKKESKTKQQSEDKPPSYLVATGGREKDMSRQVLSYIGQATLTLRNNSDNKWIIYPQSGNMVKTRDDAIKCATCCAATLIYDKVFPDEAAAYRARGVEEWDSSVEFGRAEIRRLWEKTKKSPTLSHAQLLMVVMTLYTNHDVEGEIIEDGALVAIREPTTSTSTVETGEPKFDSAKFYRDLTMAMLLRT